MRQPGAGPLTATGKLQVAIQRNRRSMHCKANKEYQPVLLFPTPPHPEMIASVIIPVKNEAHHLTQTLDNLRLQQDETGKHLCSHHYEILVLANNCTDDSYAVALSYQKKHSDFPLHIASIELEKKAAHIGTARRLLMDEAFRRHQLTGHDGIILSTDGDTEVDYNWISNTIKEMQNGCDAVGGRILTRQVAGDSKRYYLQDTTYRYLSAQLEARLCPTGNDSHTCHFQCFGASLAVRASVYHKAGRLPVLPFLEDEAFHRALHRIDARVKRSSIVRVYTSSRLHGRVQVGLSAHLSHLGEMKKNNIQQYVESLQTLTEKWNLKNQVRACWQQRKTEKTFSARVYTLAKTIDMSPRWLMREMDISQYFGELWEKVESKLYNGSWRKKQTPVAIEQAIQELRKALQGQSD